eukprot:gene3921-4287_t
MKIKTVVITGGAGRIAYSLIPLILSGQVFGPENRINLHLLDIPAAQDRLKGVEMEVEDCGYSLLNRLLATTNPDEAFQGAEVVVLLGGCPRQPGMERKDLLLANAEAIRSQVESLNRHGGSHTKVVVVTNPANSSCLVAIKAAPNIPPQNFTCLTRLDQERLRVKCAAHLSKSRGVRVDKNEIHDVRIWGNHSTTMVVDVDDAKCVPADGSPTFPVGQFVDDASYGNLLKEVQDRGYEIIKYLQVTSAMSAAESIVKHLRDWLGPSQSGSTSAEPFCMGVLSTGNSYGVPDDLVFSFPCERSDDASGYRIVRGLQISTRTRQLLDLTAEELVDERSKVATYL